MYVTEELTSWWLGKGGWAGHTLSVLCPLICLKLPHFPVMPPKYEPISGSAPTQSHLLLMTRSTRQRPSLNTWSFQRALHTLTSTEAISPCSVFPVKIFFAFIYLLYAGVCSHGCRHATPHVWRSLSSLWELHLPFHSIEPGGIRSGCTPGGEPLYLLSHLSGPLLNSVNRHWVEGMALPFFELMWLWGSHLSCTNWKDL